MPNVLPHAVYYWHAYQTLASRRLVIDGIPQAIQISEIAAYTDYLGIDDQPTRRAILRIVLALDSEFINFRPAKTTPTPPPRKQRR